MARHRMPFRESIAVVAVLVLDGCAGVNRLPPGPESFREELKAAMPDLRDDEIVVPFEVRPEDVSIAREATKPHFPGRDKAIALAEALYDAKWFGLRYDWARNGSAIETIESGHGSCVSLSSVYVGLARSLGLKAHYVEASYRPERFQDGEVIVSAGHVGAAVKSDKGVLLFGFGVAPDRRVERVRSIDDVEALAHLYNNRGYQVVRGTEEGAARAAWEEASRYFRLATRVRPGFAGAWNNLGIAQSRLGSHDEAKRSYLAAMSLDSGLASPHQNLGSLYLQVGRLEAALAELEIAAQLDPQSPFVHYLVAVARARTGALAEAERSVERSIELEGNYAPARALRTQIHRQLAASEVEASASLE